MAAAVWRHRTKIYQGGADIVKDLRAHPRTRSEAAVVAVLEELTGAKFPTVNPDWLIYKGRTLELDGYNADLRLALEFSGPLHTKWFPNKESYAAYHERVMRDRAKLRICRKHGVTLIVVDSSLPRTHIRAYLRSRLFDAGHIAERPGDYIAAQTHEPYRNPQLERELSRGRAN